MTKATGKELTTTRGKRRDIGAIIQSKSSDFALALGRTMDPERFTRVAMTTVRQSRDLMECEPGSVLASIMLCAQLNLEPGPLGHAYLVPFKGKCTFILGYQGMIELAFRSGQVTEIYAELIHEHDTFKEVLGTARQLIHEPPPFGQDRGKVIGVYAVAKMRGGAQAFVTLTTDEVDRYRAMSRGRNSMMWSDHWDAAAKKTAVRQLSKWIPKSTDLARAIAADDAAERGGDQVNAAGFNFAGMEGGEAVGDEVYTDEASPEYDPETGEELPPAVAS